MNGSRGSGHQLAIPFVIDKMKTSLILLLLLVSPQALAADQFEIRDPAGDDVGTGELLYPNRGDLRSGDLDILSFSAENTGDGTWFTARFQNPVRGPGSEVTEIGQVPISRIARHDFYTFNIDVYIDTDVISGSGNTEGLPGRKITIDRATAWEKTVLLTPRPGVARSLLASHFERIEEQALRAEQGRVTGEDKKRIAASVQARLNERYYMPDRIRVRNRDISFFVPADFLGGAASEDWAYAIVVTGANVEQTTRLASAPEDFMLMNLPVERGISFRNFGLRGESDVEQPPVVDYVNPLVGWQRARLSDYNLARNLYASVVGVIPSGKRIHVAPQVNRNLPPPEPASQPRSIDVRRPAAAKESAAPIPTGESLADRLRAIRVLRDQGLLTEGEYQTIRRRLLSEY